MEPVQKRNKGQAGHKYYKRMEIFFVIMQMGKDEMMRKVLNGLFKNKVSDNTNNITVLVSLKESEFLI